MTRSSMSVHVTAQPQTTVASTEILVLHVHILVGLAYLLYLWDVVDHYSLSLSTSSCHAVQIVDPHLNSMLVIPP